MPITVDPSQVQSITVDPSQVQPASAPQSGFDGFLGQVKDAIGTAAHELNPVTMAKGLNSAIQSVNPALGMDHAAAGVKAIMQTNEKSLEDAKAAWNRGDHVAAAVHAFNYLVPFGSALNDQTNDVEQGHMGKALGKALAFGVQMAAPEAIAGAAKAAGTAARAIGESDTGAAVAGAAKNAGSKIVDLEPRPLPQAVEDLAAKYEIPLTRGMQGGSKTVQAAEKMLGHTVAPDLYEPIIEKAQQGLNAGAKDLASGFATDQFTAGEKTISSMMNKAKEFEDQAKGEYETLAKLEADPKNVRAVQVGTKLNSSPDPTAPDKIPATETMGLPVDMRPTKQALAPLADEIQRRMTPAQRRADPGLSAIQNILTRPDALPASVAEGDLSYLKEIMRGDAPAQAKRLAGAAIDALDKQVQAAVAQAGPDAVQSLTNAREAWKARSFILDTLKDLTNDTTGSEGQVLLTKKLLQPSDAAFPKLQQVLTATPEAAEDLGKAYLTDHVFKSVSDGGNLTPVQASNLWNHIGPRTKAALYTPEQVANIDNFMQLAKRVGENPNPPNTGSLNAMLKIGVLATAPVSGGVTIVAGRNLAKALYTPAGAAALNVIMKAPESAEAARAMTALQTALRVGATAKQAQGNRDNVIPFPGPMPRASNQ